MRVQTLLLALFALFALGCTVWFFLGVGEPSQEGLGASGVNEKPLGPDTELALPEVSTPDNTSGTGSAREAVSVTQTEPDTQLAARSGRAISGRVVDTFGNPLPKARVYFVASGNFIGGSLQNMADAGSPFSRAQSKVQQVESDEQGEFTVDSSLRGQVQFEVRAERFAPLSERRAVQGGDQAKLDDFVLEQGLHLSGHVLDEAGNGIAGVELHEIQQQSGGFVVNFFGGASRPLAISSSDGAFSIDELPAGPYALRLEHENHPNLKVTGGEEQASKEITGLRYVMADGYQILGRVRGIESGDEPQYAVRARPVDEFGDDEDGGIAAGRLGAVSRGGAFELRGLLEGTYRLQVIEADSETPMFASGRSAAVQASTGSVDTELNLREASALTFQVVNDETGEPQEQFEIEYGTAPFMQSLRDEEGEIQGEHPGGLVHMSDLFLRGSGTVMGLKISAHGYSDFSLESVSLVLGETQDLGVLRLVPVPSILVTVLDAATLEPVEGAEVTLSEMPEEQEERGGRRMALSLGAVDGEEEGGPDINRLMGRESTTAMSDQTGVARVPSLPGKRCKLTISHRNYAEYTQLDVALPERGNDELTAHMQAGGVVTVTVLSADGGPQKGVRVRQSLVEEGGPSITGGPGTRKSRSDGTVTFKHLPAGTHNFQIVEGGGSGMFTSRSQVIIAGMGTEKEAKGQDIVVTEGSETEVTLHARAEGFLAGVLTEGGEALVGATLTFEEQEEDRGSAPGLPGMPGFGGGTSTRTDGRGKFKQEALKVGFYTVSISHPERIMDAEFEVEIRSGENSEDFDLDVAILEGRIVDSEGQPAVGVEVRPERFVEDSGAPRQQIRMTMVVQGDSGGAMSISNGVPLGAAVRTDADGHYSLRGVTPDVKLVVESTSDRYQEAKSEPVTVGSNQTRGGVDFEVFLAGSIRVTVQDADGSPASYVMANLDFTEDVENPPATQREMIGESGTTTVKSLRPGIWRVGARSLNVGGGGGRIRAGGPGGGQPAGGAEPMEVEVLPGETVDVTLVLPESK